MAPRPNQSGVMIACGGTGGHLFPGMAIAEALQRRGVRAKLLVSSKSVDQEAVRSAPQFETATLPAVALQNRNVFSFFFGFLASYRLCRRWFVESPPAAVLSLGGFTSVPALLAGSGLGLATFMHEANAVPGRANRWLARRADQAYVFFASARNRLRAREVIVTGMPVRPVFRPADAAVCRKTLGLDPVDPVLLVTGGSQGASGINDLVMRSLPALLARMPRLQFIHLSGHPDLEKVGFVYRQARARAVVLPFLATMEQALGAASLAVGRAGASSIAELAAMRVPAVLIPFPFAADDHQRCNARELTAAGAAEYLEPNGATPEQLTGLVQAILSDAARQAEMKRQLARWFVPDAADQVARHLMQKTGLSSVERKASEGGATPASSELSAPVRARMNLAALG